MQEPSGRCLVVLSGSGAWQAGPQPREEPRLPGEQPAVLRVPIQQMVRHHGLIANGRSLNCSLKTTAVQVKTRLYTNNE